MPRHQQVNVWKVRMGQQLFLRLPAHIPGDEGRKAAGGGQHSQSQLVCLPTLAHRWKDLYGAPLTQVKIGIPADKIQLASPLLGQSDDLLPQRIALLHVGQGNCPYRDPAQQLGDAVSVVGMVMGHYQQIQPGHSLGLDVVGGHIPWVSLSLSAAVHQR